MRKLTALSTRIAGRHQTLANPATLRGALPPRLGSGREVRLAVWFDGSLSVKKMGALLFMRAGTGKGRRVFRRELQARFGWSHPTTGKVIAGLEARGLLIKHEAHRDGGRFVGAPTYEVQQLLRDRLAAAGVKKPGNGAATNVKKPGDGLPGYGFAANYYLPTDPQDAPPSGAPLGRTVSKETGQCGSQCETRVTRRKDCQTEGCKNAAVGGRGERGVL